MLDRRNPRAAAYLAAYHIKKIGPYYEKRIPRRYRRAYIRDFVDILHAAKIVIPPDTSANKPTRLSVRLGIFEHQRYALFQALIAGKNELMPRYKRLRSRVRKLKHRSDRSSAWSAALESALQQEVEAKSISFIGLDFKYAGNSRYLFEEMIRDPRFADRTIRFVTSDKRVDDRYRLEPGKLETNAALARSEVLIAESWIPPRVRKHRDSTWIQLWHGTPIKRMLFDSHEPRIIWNRRHHKINKYRDIQNWDYLVVDSPVAAEKFETAFLFDPGRMIRSGYPRVKYLLEHADDLELKLEIRRKLGIADEFSGRVALYAPTWRDYNYGRSPAESDFEYLLDVEGLAEKLGEDWIVLFHDHGYLSSKVSTSSERCIDASAVETQDLLLVTDAVVSDYSSIVFDALAIDRSIVMYAPDQERFEESRGLYEDIWADLASVTAGTLDEVVSLLASGESLLHSEVFAERYVYSAGESLAEVVLSHPGSRR